MCGFGGGHGGRGKTRIPRTSVPEGGGGGGGKKKSCNLESFAEGMARREKNKHTEEGKDPESGNEPRQWGSCVGGAIKAARLPKQ